MTKCKVVLLFSGKRKSGKDHITELLASRIGENATIIRLVESNVCDVLETPEVNKIIIGHRSRKWLNRMGTVSQQ